MCSETSIIFLILFCVVFLIITTNPLQGFEGGTQKMVQDVIANKKLIQEEPLNQIKQELPWIDPVLYYDIKKSDMSEQFLNRYILGP